jgi:hypothetical protein
MGWLTGLSVKTWIYVAVVLVIAGLATAVKVQTARLASEKAAFAEFKVEVKVIGQQAELHAKMVEAQDKRDKEKIDEQTAKDHTTIAALTRKLRDNNPPSSTLPEAPANSKRPDLLCLDRAEYKRTDGEAIKRLFEGARGLADEGTANTIDLNAGKSWAQKR